MPYIFLETDDCFYFFRSKIEMKKYLKDKHLDIKRIIEVYENNKHSNISDSKIYSIIKIKNYERKNINK